jgi:hypothetical protein
VLSACFQKAGTPNHPPSHPAIAGMPLPVLRSPPARTAATRGFSVIGSAPRHNPRPGCVSATEAAWRKAWFARFSTTTSCANRGDTGILYPTRSEGIKPTATAVTQAQPPRRQLIGGNSFGSFTRGQSVGTAAASSLAFGQSRRNLSTVNPPSMYTTSFAFFEALWDAGVSHCFVNLGSDHPSIIEAMVKGAREKKDRFPRIITCPNEVDTHLCSPWPCIAYKCR